MVKEVKIALSSVLEPQRGRRPDLIISSAARQRPTRQSDGLGILVEIVAGYGVLMKYRFFEASDDRESCRNSSG